MPPWSDFDPLLCGSTVIGVLIAIVNFVFLLRRGKKPPQLAGFLEIVLASIGIGTAFAVCRLAWILPTITTAGQVSFTVTQLDRIYLFVGAFPMIWVAGEAIIRRFKI